MFNMGCHRDTLYPHSCSLFLFTGHYMRQGHGQKCKPMPMTSSFGRQQIEITGGRMGYSMLWQPSRVGLKRGICNSAHKNAWPFAFHACEGPHPCPILHSVGLRLSKSIALNIWELWWTTGCRGNRMSRMSAQGPCADCNRSKRLAETFGEPIPKSSIDWSTGRCWRGRGPMAPATSPMTAMPQAGTNG